MKKEFISLNEKKQILLEMLLFLKDFCYSQGIKWCLAYGSLLGAVRHGGFIPWDDDIDVIMKRNDYMRFLEIFRERQGKYCIATFENGSYYYPFSKLIDMRTTIVSDHMINYPQQGVSLDIFVFDVLSDDKNETQKMLIDVMKKNRLLNYSVVRNVSSIPGRYRLLRIPYFILAHILGNKVIANQYIKVLHKYCKYKGKKFGGILGEDTHIYASEWFDETEMMSFEGYAFPVPHEYDLVLRTYYGNYMQMPKCENRVGHSEQAYYRYLNKML